jgi:hypothetical protein
MTDEHSSTHQRRQSKTGQQSIIDVTFINTTVSNNTIIKEWQINHKISFAADHFPITWNIDQGKQYMNIQSENN